MGNAVVHFEIHGQNPDVLHAFYRKVFGWSIDSNNPMAYGVVDTNSGGKGINGGIATGAGERGVMVYIDCDDVKATLDRAVAAGAELVMEPNVIPGLVELATFRDPEGNYLGLTKDLSSTR
jgi:predicted enzyme related to lactoylglutathione lyase